MAAMVWSPQQAAVFSFVMNADGNLVVRARAGTGKTTTIVEAVQRWLSGNPGKTVTVCAFGKDIQEELKARFEGFPVDVRTLHSLGLSAVKKYWPTVIPSYSNERERALAEAVCGPTAPDDIKRLVGKGITKGRLCAPLARNMGELTSVLLNFDCVPPEEWANDGYDLDWVEAKVLEGLELAATVKPKVIDGADMLFLPVRNRWLRATQDLVVVDECQDMNVCQLAIAQGICRGRIIVVGDDRQAIFAFAGADSDSLDRLKIAYRATELGLNVTRRCAHAVVQEARRFVPDFEAHADNPQGAVHTILQKQLVLDAAPGDFILSRTNAPLVSTAMSLLRAGKRTRVAGKDIGSGLIGLVRKIKGSSVARFLEGIERWRDREHGLLAARFKGKDLTDNAYYNARYEMINDQANMLLHLADGVRSVDAIIDRIEALFAKDEELAEKGIIVCSSVHKAKGKEADRVFILADTLRPSGDTEERNICYVAVTRAKQSLVYVTGVPVEQRHRRGDDGEQYE